MNDSTETDTVSVGEVCSISVAKTLQIDDIDNDGYYKQDYADVLTFNDVTDNGKTTSYALCEITKTDGKNGVASAPLCVLQSTAGFGFTKTRGTGIEYDTCITAECPTGFTIDPQNEKLCIKPKEPNRAVRSTLNQERWYDWFMIPDYHLGNKYVRENDINYAPCIKGSIPSYEIDPVDNAKKSFTSKHNEIEKCVLKDKYFGGKYFNSETYCPMTWVFRAGATKKNLKDMYIEKIAVLENTNRGNENLDTLTRDLDNLVRTDIYEPVIKYGFNDYVGKSQSEEAKLACTLLQNDPVKKDAARVICKTIEEVGKDEYIERLKNENNEDISISKKKYTRAIQGCHTVFCDDSPDKICFPEVEKKNLEEQILLEEKIKAESEKERPIIDTANEKRVVFKKTADVIYYLSIVIASIVGLFIFSKTVWPFLIKYVIPRLKAFINWVSRKTGMTVGFVTAIQVPVPVVPTRV